MDLLNRTNRAQSRKFIRQVKRGNKVKILAQYILLGKKSRDMGCEYRYRSIST